jgi:hypothetical protein
MAWRARYFLNGGIALIIVLGLVRWQFLGGRGEVLKPDGGPVVTVMDFGRNFPLDPLPSGWRHRQFWTRSPMTMAFAVKDGVPGMRFETGDSASMLFRAGLTNHRDDETTGKFRSGQVFAEFGPRSHWVENQGQRRGTFIAANIHLRE